MGDKPENCGAGMNECLKIIADAVAMVHGEFVDIEAYLDGGRQSLVRFGAFLVSGDDEEWMRKRMRSIGVKVSIQGNPGELACVTLYGAPLKMIAVATHNIAASIQKRLPQTESVSAASAQ